MIKEIIKNRQEKKCEKAYFKAMTPLNNGYINNHLTGECFFLINDTNGFAVPNDSSGEYAQLHPDFIRKLKKI